MDPESALKKTTAREMLAINSGGSWGYRRASVGTRRKPPPAPIKVPNAPIAIPKSPSSSQTIGTSLLRLRLALPELRGRSALPAGHRRDGVQNGNSTL